MDREKDAAIRGEKAQRILESEEWQGAWTAYNDKLNAQWRQCDSSDKDRLQHIKMLQLAGEAARSYLELLMKNGQVSLKNIEFQGKQSRMQRLLNAIK